MQISSGCNCACSYCIVPSTRGREASRPAAELLAEVHGLAADGVREVTLLGQNVNSYGRDLRDEQRTTFAELLREIDAIDGIERVRYTSPHPKDMREDVIRAHAECASLCEHIHLPLQSGSSPILKAMRRTYNRERYLDRVALIREHLPDCALTTDIIVGFPGETDDDFEADARRRRDGRLRRRVHVRLLAASRDRGRRPGREGPAPGQEGADGAARRGRAAARPRTRRAVRRPDDGRPRRGTEPDRPLAPAGTQPPQQGGQLRGNRPARRDRRRRDQLRDVADLLGSEVLLSRVD